MQSTQTQARINGFETIKFGRFYGYTYDFIINSFSDYTANLMSSDYFLAYPTASTNLSASDEEREILRSYHNMVSYTKQVIIDKLETPISIDNYISYNNVTKDSEIDYYQLAKHVLVTNINEESLYCTIPASTELYANIISMFTLDIRKEPTERMLKPSIIRKFCQHELYKLTNHEIQNLITNIEKYTFTKSFKLFEIAETIRTYIFKNQVYSSFISSYALHIIDKLNSAIPSLREFNENLRTVDAHQIIPFPCINLPISDIDELSIKDANLLHLLKTSKYDIQELTNKFNALNKKQRRINELAFVKYADSYNHTVSYLNGYIQYYEYGEYKHHQKEASTVIETEVMTYNTFYKSYDEYLIHNIISELTYEEIGDILSSEEYKTINYFIMRYNKQINHPVESYARRICKCLVSHIQVMMMNSDHLIDAQLLKNIING